MKRIALLLLLLVPSLVQGQIYVDSAPPVADVEKAKATLQRNQPIILKMDVGYFEIAKTKKAEDPAAKPYPMLWLPSNPACLEIRHIKAGVQVEIYGVRVGDTGPPRWYTFEADPLPWSVLKAIQPGKSITSVIRNGDDAKMVAPYVLNTIDVTIGGKVPNPDPEPNPNPDPTPVNPDVDAALLAALKGTLATDKANAAGVDWSLASKWASTYQATANLLRSGDPALKKPANADELYSFHKGSWIAAGVPTQPFLSATRDYISTLLAAEIGTNKTTPLDVKKAAALYRKIGVALEEALK